jgi:aldehyde dehydrogenase (NAD+)
VSHPVPRVVSFTGSTETGIGIARLAGIKRLLLELGGNAPLVVLDDADLDYAVESAVFGSFFNSGQICMIANRVIVDAKLHDDFVDRFVARTSVLRVGDPADPATFIGPVISRRQLDSVQDKVDRAVAAGAELLLGGQPVGPAGLALPPQVLLGGNELATAREEVFGPVITIIRARDEDHALELANDTEYGLSSAVHTRDRERGTRFALRLNAGMTHVNDSPVNEEDNTAYGGERQSGLGRFGGAWSVEELTTHHWVSVQHQRRPYPLG